MSRYLLSVNDMRALVKMVGTAATQTNMSTSEAFTLLGQAITDAHLNGFVYLEKGRVDWNAEHQNSDIAVQEIPPCPICGEKNVTVGGGSSGVQMGCPKCGVRGPIVDTLFKALKSWRQLASFKFYAD